MKISFNQYLILGLILAIFISFVLKQDIYLSLILLAGLINFLIFLGCVYVNIIIHEFGHAIAGWLVKIPIKRISIGSGHNIFKYKFNDTTLLINQGLQGGFTRFGTFPERFLRLRFFCFVLGGVGLQAVAIVLVKILLEVMPSYNSFLFSIIARNFLLSNYILMIINLLPFNANIMGIPMPTDGLQLLTILFAKKQKIQEILLTGKIAEGLEYLEEKNYQQAESIFCECSTNNSTILIPQVNLSVALIRQQKIDDAIELLSKLLAEVENNPRKLFIFNNLAWSYLIKGLNQPEFLNQADEYSTQAFKIGKKAYAVVGTRACVLIETGEVDAGIKLLKPQVSLNHALNDNTNSVIGFLYLAYAYYLKGNVKQSQKYWQKIKDHQELKSSEYRLFCNHVLKKTNYFAIP